MQGRLRIGLAMMIFSFFPWMAIPLVPLFPFLDSVEIKLKVATALFIAAELFFWVGVLFTGKQTWNIIKQHGWRQTPKRLWTMFWSGSCD